MIKGEFASGNISNKYGTAARCICMILIVIMLVIGIAVYGASAAGSALCALFFIVYVILPGLMGLRVFGIRGEHISTSLASAAFLGWALCVFLAYLTSLIRTDLVLLLAGPVMSCLYLKILFSERKTGLSKTRNFKLSRIPVSFCIFFVLVLLFCLIGTQYQYLSPPKGDFAFISGDRAYHMGMANAASHNLPLESLWIKGLQIKYHIFTDILFSVPIKLFDVRTDTVGQFFAPVLTAFLVGISLYAFFKEMSGRPERAGVYCLVFFLSGMYITRRWTSSLAFKFIFTNDNCAGFGLAAMLVFIIIFKKWSELYNKRDREQWGYLAVCLILVMLITGIKGPIGAVVVAALWGSVMLGLILRKIPLRILAPTLIITIGFIAVYVGVLGAVGQVNTAGGASLSFAKIVDIAFWKEPLVDIMKSLGLPKVLRMPVVMLAFAAFFFTTFLIPFCMGYVREVYLVLSGKKAFCIDRVLVYALALVGFICLMIFDFTGHNQVYFGLVTIILAPVISFWFLEDMESRSEEYPKTAVILKPILAIMLLTLLLSTISIGGYYVRRGAEAVGYARQTIALSKYGGVSRDEYDAMMWIRKNTDKDALLANDRYYSVPLDEYSIDNRWDNSFFLYELYANRFSYISGSAYDLDQRGSGVRKERIANNLRLYDPNNPDRGDLARQLGIDYVIVSKRFSGELNLKNDDYTPCYTNDEVDIYKIEQK